MSQTDPALSQLRKLLPLDDESLTQILEYSRTLPPADAAEHLKNLVGDSPRALEFISSFNARRPAPAAQIPTISEPTAQSSASGDRYSSVPKHSPHKRKQQGMKKLPPVRQVDQGDVSGAYIKRDEEDYMPQKQKVKKNAALFALNDSSNPSSTASSQVPSRQPTPNPLDQISAKLPPSASGKLISDLKPSKSKTKIAKATVTGGTPMHGASTALSDLDYAIRELEITTNPTLAPTAEQNARRKCNCIATRHELLEAAPNCVNCGKIICVKEGLGPCTFCGTSLLSASEVDSMIRILREERGVEKMNMNNASQRRADVSMVPRPFTSQSEDTGSNSVKLSEAMQHRDKLLAFQAQNAKRTRIHDEAADFETPSAGLNAWASPAERAMQLKKQQKVLREQEWAARPEWEKKRVVASIDLVGGKIVRRMAKVERPVTPESEDEEEELVFRQNDEGRTFGKNPLLGGLIRPVAKLDEKGNGREAKEKQNVWRRVQDAQDDNEQWILDGGTKGLERQNTSDEPACG